MAVRYGQPDTISILLEYGIDINAANRGWTALHLAALNGHTDIASILLNKGSQTSVTNEEGRTPLDIARAEDHDRIVAIILEREFQTSQPEEVLPSPPPTPPSAPPLELFQDPCVEDVPSDDGGGGGGDGGGGCDGSLDESFTEWRSRLRNALERAGSSDAAEDGEEVDDGDRIATIDVRITWKTFEEEAKELMNQLERLRMQEVEKVKSQMLKARREGGQRLERLDRQVEVMRAQSRELEAAIPKIERKFADLVAEEGRGIERTRVLAAAAEREKQLLDELLAVQRSPGESPAACAEEKTRALEEFVRLQELEREQLGAEERRRLGTIEQLGARKEAEVAVAKEKIRILGKHWNMRYSDDAVWQLSVVGRYP